PRPARQSRRHGPGGGRRARGPYRTLTAVTWVTSPERGRPLPGRAAHVLVEEAEEGLVPDLRIPAAGDPVALVGEVQEAVTGAALGVTRGLRELVQVVPEGMSLGDRDPVVLVAVYDQHRHLDVGDEVLGVVAPVLLAHRPLPGRVVSGRAHG